MDILTLAIAKNKSSSADETITTENITNALGYKPADQEDVSKLSEDIADLKENGTGGGVVVSSVEPETDDIPKVFFSEAIPQTKDDATTAFRYISKTKDISGYAEFKAQGNSSMSYPKKNMTVKMYSDEALTEKLKVDFKEWGEQAKHVYKANWIDLTHARNIVSARLWADVVKSRENYLELPELLRTSPNQGSIDGFPVKVYSKGIYQGRYTLNIPKDAWMANMDDALDSHCILCGENYASGCFRATANINGNDWSDEVHETVPNSIKTRWNEVISFVMNSTDEEFVANLENYFFVDSLIDYFIFGMVSCGLDAFGKNQLYFTYDGMKWIASMYDMDSTWGLYWNGSKFVSASYTREEFEDFVNTNGNLLYVRLAQLFYERIQTRYAELKNGALSVPNIINRFERFTDIASLDLVKEDYASTTGGGKFTGIPSQTTNNIQQIRKFVVDRYAYCDEYIASLSDEEPSPDVPDEPIVPDEPTLLYELPQQTTFNGTSDYIDTGVNLNNKPYTVLVDFESNRFRANDTILDNMNEYSPYPGWALDLYYDNYYPQTTRLANKNGTIIQMSDTDIANKRTKCAIRCTEDNVLTAFSVIYPNGKVVTGADMVATIEHNLLIGAYYNNGNGISRHFSGTVYDCKVYDAVLSDEEIQEYLTAESEPEVPEIQTSLVYELAEPTTFDGTNYIDTGIQLFKEDKPFTVCLDWTHTGESAFSNGSHVIAHCMHEIAPYNGLICQYTVDSIAYQLIQGTNSTGRAVKTDVGTNSRIRGVFKKSADGNASIRVKIDENEVKETTSTTTFNAINETLLLGCYQTTDGTKGRFAKGIMNDCKVYDNALSDEEINAFLMGDDEPTEGTFVEEYLAENYLPNGQSFSHTVEDILLADGDCIEAKMDFSTCVNSNENVLSVGKSIANWEGYNYHLYYSKSSNELSVIALNANFSSRTERKFTCEEAVVKIDKDGIYLNGEKVGADSAIFSEVKNELCNATTIQVGSQEGTTRSNATYEYIKVARKES